MARQNNKQVEKELLNFAENGDLEGLENTIENNQKIPKTLLNQALISLCKNYKTMGQYENCMSLLLRYNPTLSTLPKKATVLRKIRKWQRKIFAKKKKFSYFFSIFVLLCSEFGFCVERDFCTSANFFV